MEFIFLGIIIGIVATGFLVILSLLLKTPIERKIRQAQSQLKEKGKIFEPEDSEVQDWISNLKQE